MNALEKYAAKKRLVAELQKVALFGAAAKGLKLLGRGMRTPATGIAAGGAALTGAAAKRGPVGPPKPPGGGSLLSPNSPAAGTPKAKKWTASANRNAQRTGAGGRWNFNTQQSQPVTQSTQSGLTTGR